MASKKATNAIDRCITIMGAHGKPEAMLVIKLKSENINPIRLRLQRNMQLIYTMRI